MDEPIFMSRDWVDELHRLSLEQHGGQDGLRNDHGLESALAQPMNAYFYGQGDLFDLAAAYAYHVAENQPLIDGNKRTAITTALFFLEQNGINTSAVTNDELYDAMIGIAKSGSTRPGWRRFSAGVSPDLFRPRRHAGTAWGARASRPSFASCSLRARSYAGCSGEHQRPDFRAVQLAAAARQASIFWSTQPCLRR